MCASHDFYKPISNITQLCKFAQSNLNTAKTDLWIQQNENQGEHMSI